MNITELKEFVINTNLKIIDNMDCSEYAEDLVQLLSAVNIKSKCVTYIAGVKGKFEPLSWIGFKFDYHTVVEVELESGICIIDYLNTVDTVLPLVWFEVNLKLRNKDKDIYKSYVSDFDTKVIYTAPSKCGYKKCN